MKTLVQLVIGTAITLGVAVVLIVILVPDDPAPELPKYWLTSSNSVL